MKKKITTLTLLALLFSSTSCYAYDYPDSMKKEFYDNFIAGVGLGARQSLLSQGYEKTSVDYVVYKMQSRINRSELENATWSCVSQYTPEQMLQNTQQITQQCFSDWFMKFMTDTSDLSKLLKK